MSADADDVWRIEKGGVNDRFADHVAQKAKVAAVPATDAVVAEDPDVPGLAARLPRNRGNNVVIRILLAPEQHVELARGEAGDRQIHVEVESGQVSELHL